MSGWDTSGAAAGNQAWDAGDAGGSAKWNGGGAEWNDGGGSNAATFNDNTDGQTNGEFNGGFTAEGGENGDAGAGGDACRNCGQGHTAMECKNPKVIDNAHVAEKSEDEAWALLKEASDERDITDFKEAVQILSKTAPDYTYPRLEKEFRKRGYNVYLIAMEKDHGETWTNVNLQGEVGKKYAVSYFLSDKPQRPTLIEKWPASAEDNLTRLSDAGVPLDRGVDKCNNCGNIGHKSKACTEEKMEKEQVKVQCHLCGEDGHRVRDCTQERRKAGRACKICESEEHLAKDCPNREKRACRNCGDEDHMAKECPNREVRTCHNCGEEDHISKDCTQPRKQKCRICDAEDHLQRDCPKKDEAGPRPRTDWSKVTCSVCQQIGHGRARCPNAEKGDPGYVDNENAAPNGEADVGGGAWATNNTSSSAPADWDQDGNNFAAPAPVVAGSGW
ncbi:hypothetical protein LTR10_014783 [Elasticomyces elasticus]|uniref:CCHC-type domain-containing protein n=1 Tax=Exophiala sideris TaxID=1016849 RepID=A0ABR0JGW0_9EURO|nr:hypothetical protein LTR10_014783 [Elasticomyces elasticus]KAK5025626.1 hypothetical protein LTS07_007830 [Exophiala sideris]KAK5033164.1 hypothetical protein LTR13_007129 [Exophiala sideris]KAK5063649.1 hypothetical protein LTR69_004355 [Exophiala sideris]KAK5180517.1 hypothetical protein LTR44_006831 [Eurotiomycetes sp. CCFEE 6388]